MSIVAARDAIEFASLPELVGETAYVSDWMTIDVEHLRLFAESCYLAPEHVDLAFSKNNPYGAELVDGFLLLSMLVFWNFRELPLKGGQAWGLNYGLNRVRWITPVMVGDNIRAKCDVLAMEPRNGGWLGTMEITVEREASEKPAMVAEWLCLFMEGDHEQ
jgi:acyl dehydratase